MEIKITKKTKLLEVNNSMVHNYYYLINGKIYKDDSTKYKKFKFVLFFDIFDLQEYYEGYEEITEEMKKEYIEEMVFCCTGMISDYNKLDDFYEFCNSTIENYNRINK